MNCAQALAIAAAGLALAGEPIQAPIAHAQHLFEISAAEGKAMSREAMHAVAAAFQTERRWPEAQLVSAAAETDGLCMRAHELDATAPLGAVLEVRTNAPRQPEAIGFNIPDASNHAAMRAPV